MSHTPGPWKADSKPMLGDSTIKVSANILDREDILKSICWVSPHDWCKGEQQANANLIAAAPDLLEACKKNVELIEAWMNGIFRRNGITWIEVPTAVSMSRDAIAKAEGREVKA